MVRLSPHKLIVFVDAVVGIELLTTTLAGKHIATVKPNFVLARHLHFSGKQGRVANRR